MLEFEASNFEELEEEARLRAVEISVAVVTAVCKGMEEGVDVVALGFLSQLGMDISIKKIDFLEALKLNLHRVEQAEEFELCAKAKECISILESE